MPTGLGTLLLIMGGALGVATASGWIRELARRLPGPVLVRHLGAGALMVGGSLWLLPGVSPPEAAVLFGLPPGQAGVVPAGLLWLAALWALVSGHRILAEGDSRA